MSFRNWWREFRACYCYTDEGGPYGGAYFVECDYHRSKREVKK